MKKVFVIMLTAALMLAFLVSSGCGKPKYSGTFEGKLPCADCPGLQTLIDLKADGTFQMEETYLERSESPMISKGTWILDKDLITFTTGDYSFIYKVISDKEIRWAPNGEEITGTDLNWSLFKK